LCGLTDAKLRVALLGFGLRVCMVPSLLLRVATAYVMGTRGYALHAQSWYRVGAFFWSRYLCLRTLRCCSGTCMSLRARGVM
jgi:hypothetical protein